MVAAPFNVVSRPCRSVRRLATREIQKSSPWPTATYACCAARSSAIPAVAPRAGARTVLAWGGDGTINEVGTVLAATGTALGIVPAGSGNGFAGELGVPWEPRAAIDTVLHGRDRLVDAGELDGRLFFNIAGIGFDAVVAEQFNLHGTLGKRGMGPYVRIGIRETFRYQAATYRV